VSLIGKALYLDLTVKPSKSAGVN